jgi:hypothetical protein
MFEIWLSCEKLPTAEMTETLQNNHEIIGSRSVLLVHHLSKHIFIGGTPIMKCNKLYGADATRCDATR